MNFGISFAPLVPETIVWVALAIACVLAAMLVFAKARGKWMRIAALQRNKQWQAEYRHARLLWLAGFEVEFPHGTYWLKRFANVATKPPPIN